MKEFEKWLENHKHANWTWEEDAREAWKAALKWTLNHPGWGCAEDEVYMAIKEELEQ